MFHRNRTWCLCSVESPEKLAGMLSTQTWTLCSAFYATGHPEYLFLNDSLSEDGAQEFAVVKRLGEQFVQVESITFSWCRIDQALHHITECLAGHNDDQARPVTAVIQTPDQHGRCPLCA